LIRENREIYSLAIDVTKLGIYDTNYEDIEQPMKENWLVRLGYNLKEIEDNHKTWLSLIHPDDFDSTVEQFQQAIDGKRNTLSMEYRLKAANGEWRWIIESSKVVDNTCATDRKRIVGTHFDITDRKLAIESERKQRKLAEALISCASIFNSTLDLSKLLNLILLNIFRIVPFDDADIWLIDVDKNIVHPAYKKGKEEYVKPISSVAFRIDEIPVFTKINTSRKPIYISDFKAEKPNIPNRNPNLRSCICSPISFGKYLLGFLVIYSFNSNFYDQQQIEHLQAFTNQAAAAIRNAQLYSTSTEVAALEERQRLAREMHDVISQTLFSASIKAETLPFLLEIDDKEAINNHIIELQKLTRGALAEMRTMLMELRPSTIINTDLSSLLQHMVDGLGGRITAKINFNSKGSGLLPPDVQTAIFRISQEALNNIVKHSKAQLVEITYIKEKRKVILEISDNGCGFQSSRILSEHMGVKIMKERADSVGASFKLSSKPKVGTSIKLTWEELQKGETNE
jgi:PAS domain S-box-containing protein